MTYRGRQHEVVVSGIAGLYPESDDVNEVWNRLINKEDMITIDSRRWVPGEFDVPPGTGKVKNPEKFDMTFFGIHRKLCEKMDPYTRLLCEQAYRAVCDAGVNPSCLDGSSTAVIMSSFMSEPEHDMGASLINHGTYNVLAFSRTMQANRISYFMNLKGPSFQLDVSGCGGIQAIQYACDLIANGICSAAIVGGCSLLNKPEPSFHFQVMGRLSEDSTTRSFSADAGGYARSEACVSIFLQRKEHAKRIYGTILAADVLTHGSKDTAFSEYPTGMYEKFLRDVYTRAEIDVNELAYVEAYGSASRKLDAMELNALAGVLLKDRKEPLLIGSVKSNLGHSEGASSMTSFTKLLLALNHGVIPPNINYGEPNPEVPDLVSGRLKVVTEPTPLKGNVVAMTEIGFVGNVSHLIVKGCEKSKSPVGDDAGAAKLPFLIMMSGRSEEQLKSNMESLETIGMDEELTILFNNLYKEGIKPHVYRGYTVITEESNTYNMIQQAPSGEKRPIWFMYSGMGSQWPTMARGLMDLPIFAKAIHRCHQVLEPKGVNLLDIVNKDDPSMFDVILNSFVGIAAVQIGLTDVLHAVGVQPDGIIGHSVGELGCAYADGCLTADQMILAAHARGRASIEAELIQGMMAAVGAGYNTMKKCIPESIEVACHNSKDSCTLSGPVEDMKKYIEEVKAKGMFAKLVNVANIAYHSRYIKPAAPALLQYLKEIIPEPKRRSSKWVSSSILESKWGSELAQYSGAEYHTNNLLSSVLFEEASAHVPSNAIVIEIAPHGLLQAIVKKSMPQAAHVPLTSRFDANNLLFLLGALGKLYLAGVPVDVEALYPGARFPVARSTPALSPFIDWLRDENFIIRRTIDDPESSSPVCKFVTIKSGMENFKKFVTHKINRRSILPPSFYFSNLIDVFTNVGTNLNLPLIVHDFNLAGHVEISSNSPVEVRLQLLQGTGIFVCTNVINEGDIIFTGKILPTDEASVSDLAAPELHSNSSESISRSALIGFMKSMGLERDESHISTDNILVDGQRVTGTAQWNGNIGDFLLSLFTLAEFYETKVNNVLKLVFKTGEMKINLPALLKAPFNVYALEYDIVNRVLSCEGVRISFVECKNPGLRRLAEEEIFYSFDVPGFVPYVNSQSQTYGDHVAICTQLVFENTNKTQDTFIKIIEIGEDPELHDSLVKLTNSVKYAGTVQMTSFLSEIAFRKQCPSVLLQKDVWLIFAKPPSHEILKFLAIMNDGFILMPKSNNGVTENTHLKIVYESLVGNAWFSLCSVSRKYQKRQYEVINLDEHYLSHLERQLLMAGSMKTVDAQIAKTVILWGEVDSLITVDSIVEETKNLTNNNFLHYYFFLGGAPVFNHDDVQFKMQIERGVKMNISLNGVWGSLRLLPANVGDETQGTERPSKFYYPLSAVGASHNLIALGLNQDHIDDPSNNDMTVYDYVTSTTMGLGTYDPHSKTFIPDKSLVWPRPRNWTPEESATVPFLYSLASYIIHHTNNAEYTNDRTILINQALTPLSQALISLSLYEKLTIYTSVTGEEEKKQLMKLFPQLKPENIFDCSSSGFYVDVLRRTNNDGIYKVINNFEDKQMIEACSKSTRRLGSLVYVNQALMEASKMGMLIFNDEILGCGATSDILLHCSDEIKMKIKESIGNALKQNSIRPISSFSALHPSTLNTDAVQYARNSSGKYVVSTSGARALNENKVYLKGGNETHIIVEGKIQVDLSLDVLEWLLKRGSRKIVVFMRQSHPFEATALKFQSLRSHYKFAEIDVRSSNQLSSQTNIQKFVEETQKPAMLFFLGSGLKEKIEMFDTILSKENTNCKLICIGKGGEDVCERRRKNSLPALYVRCSLSTLESVSLTQYLDSLVNDLGKTPVVFVNKCTKQNRSLQGLITDLTHVPEDESELQKYFRDCKPRATFVEVMTSGPKHGHNREIYPVFMIPGLRPGRLHRMASQLYCSAYEARLPSNMTDIDQVANDLVNQLVALPQNMFTLIAEDWGSILALQIAAKLEALSKIVTVILLQTTPLSTVKWVDNLLNNEMALIAKYLQFNPEVELNHASSWDERLDVAIENTKQDSGEEKKQLARDSLNSLRNHLISVSKAKPPANRIRNKVHLFELSTNVSDHQSRGFKEYLRREPIVHVKDAENLTQLIDSVVSTDINMLNLFEYKDAANPPIEEYLGLNIAKKPHWESSLLYRVRV
ncbi:polyketide synthase [Nesidiocoris tenuis]|uniref:Polyketide synthase n=1 Tax=Nesidiocoris tenuis TaxID=355587 RepID=A0ABN7ALS9_9HEMI|nr:polyketide synthase [Nesidiocoris tenuis]